MYYIRSNKTREGNYSYLTTKLDYYRRPTTVMSATPLASVPFNCNAYDTKEEALEALKSYLSNKLNQDLSNFTIIELVVDISIINEIVANNI